MTNAIAVGDYCIGHARAVFDLMGADPAVEAAKTLLCWIERERPERFTVRQMFTGVSRSRFAKVGDLDGPLALLADHGYIRRAADPQRTGPGRPSSPTYEVNPLTAKTA